MAKKIVFLGPIEAGKTSLRKFIFEATPADKLLNSSEPATIGMKFNTYQYVYTYPIEREDECGEKIPMVLVLVDCAGQEIERWLNESREMVFGGADIIFFVFDVAPYFEVDTYKEYILELMSLTQQARTELAPESQFFILAHKFDKLQNKIKKETVSNRVKSELSNYIFDRTSQILTFDVFPTSLAKEYRQDTFFMMLNRTTNLLSMPI
jgi:hypothetical protein